MTDGKKNILADGRWSGPHGIGRFSTEVLSRLQNTDILTGGPKPLSLQNFIWLPQQLKKHKDTHKVFFTPGFNPILTSPLPFVFTIHDLIHLHAPTSCKIIKRAFYELFMRPAARKAYKILTVSEYSKHSILEWAKIPASRIVVVGCGISENLKTFGEKHNFGRPYLLHVGNTKAHKNVGRLLRAFATAKIDTDICLVLTGELSPQLAAIIQKYKLEDRIILSGTLSEDDLANYYRGALAVVFPSLYEGFGLPPLEAMACGVPALTSNLTSMPEVTGDAAVLVDPYKIESIKDGIEKIVNDGNLREILVAKGFERVKLFSWDKTTAKIQKVLDET